MNFLVSVAFTADISSYIQKFESFGVIFLGFFELILGVFLYILVCKLLSCFVRNP
eukprot:TRINITY_DN16715_c0_g1_i1.p2 TRINITY_DN16715_c0_g1~~TRINITY_DN16715_c0_g1_i1.p2  ORF type:complete len:55 (+),score=3.49 TRINITY_DN16715_c0_g1_i1:342-506(+)